MQLMQTMVSSQAAQFFANSCTPMSGNKRYQVLREDFEDICDGDVHSAHALRYLENETNKKIAHLRAVYGIPDGYLPAKDDLWITTTSRDIERSTLRASSSATYNRRLSETPWKKGAPMTLPQRGFVERRIIARRYYASREIDEDIATTEYFDEEGWFIVVNESGEYEGVDGVIRRCSDVGYDTIQHQCLYGIEEINTATARLECLDPPPPAPRWPSTIRTKKSGDGSSTGDGNHHEATNANREEDTNNTLQAQGGSKSTSTGLTTSEFNDITTFRDNSINFGVYLEQDAALARNLNTHIEQSFNGTENYVHASHNNAIAVRTAPWSAETVLALSSVVLAVPDQASIDPDTWEKQWAEPARRLFEGRSEVLSGLDPRLAWERIDLVERFMALPGSPSWWQTKRKTKSPVTLKNIADRLDEQWGAYLASSWIIEGRTVYEGETMIIEVDGYSSGYTGNDLPGASVESPTVEEGVVEVVVGDAPALVTESEAPPPQSSTVVDDSHEPPMLRQRPRGMSNEQAHALGREMLQEFPALIVRIRRPKGGDDESWFVAICTGPGDKDWGIFKSPVPWRFRGPEREVQIDDALEYAASLQSGGAQQ